MINNEVIENIKNAISEVEKSYRQTKGLILSESDLKCILYNKLFEDFREETETMDPGIKSIPLHTEVAYHDKNKKLVFKPDMILLNPRSMKILNSKGFKVEAKEIKKTPSKGYIFGGDSIIIELKFCRNKHGITPSKILSYKKDIEKIKRIQEVNSENKVYGFLVIFNKTDKKGEFDEFYEENKECDNIEIIYKSGKTEWPNNN